jgi:CubicO group peptidase (beta-lactamase class C family)
MVQFSRTVLDSLRQTVDTACTDPKSDIPGATVVIVGRDGKELFAHCAGKRGVNSHEPMTQENIYWIASCTKLIVGIGCLQLVEQGKLALDDSNQLEELCPELKSVKVLQDGGTLVEKKTGITLRMLLTHTGTS